MGIPSADALIELMRQARLLGSAQMEEVAGPLRMRLPDPLALARELVGRGWLTPYQVNQLFLGRGHDLLLGSYVLLERIGEGGMGQVFKARNWKFDKLVALKLIRKDRLANASAVKRFAREIREAARLDHPNIVRAYDADEVAGTYLFAMEYVPGIDLSRHVKANGPLPLHLACECIRQAALGLEHAFEKGMVHRDIKPSNLLMVSAAAAGDEREAASDAAETVSLFKILDMGLARSDGGVNSEESTTLTQEGLVMGTPDYLAPEQALDSHGVDIRADLYSLGCTFYFLLSGRPPFAGGSTLEKLIRHREQDPVPVEELRPEVPPAVGDIVRRLMAKHPDERFQAPGELAEALAGDFEAVQPATTAVTLTAPPLNDPGWSVIVDTPTTDTLDRSSWMARLKVPPPGRGSWIGAGLAAVAVAMAVTGLAVYWNWTPEPTTPPVVLPPPGPAPKEPTETRKLAALAVGLKLRAEPLAHPGGVTALAVSPTGSAVASAGVTKGAFLKLWDPASGKEIRPLPQPSDVPLALAFKRDGSILAVAGRGGSIALCEPATGNARPAIPTESAEVRGVAFVSEGRLLAWADRADNGNGPRVLRFRELASRHEPPPVNADAEQLLAVAASPTGVYVATAGEGGRARLFEGAGRPLPAVQSFAGPCTALAFSPDAKVLAAAGPVPREGGSGLCVRLVNVPKGEPRGTLPVHAAITALAFSPDSSVLAVACTDGTIRLWDWDGCRELAVVPAHSAAVRALAFTDAKTLASGGDDGKLRLWDVVAADPPTDTLARTRIVNPLGMELQLVPAATFEMGEDSKQHPQLGPRHKVRLTRPYYLGAHEVTVGQFRNFIHDSGHVVEPLTDGTDWESPGWEQSDRHPVVAISHDDAAAFCRWLSQREGRTYRLPTEAEWERAAERAAHNDAGWDKPAPVGCYPMNPLGLCDMLGNVAEWCADGYDPAYYRTSDPADPPGPPPGADTEHTVRGGSFDAGAGSCTATFREGRTGRHRSVGFRVLMEPSTEDLLPWQPLLNDRNLDGWKVNKGRRDDWSVQDGRLVCKGGVPGWIGTTERYADFVLRLEWRIAAKGDSGVYVRVPADTGNPAFTGIEMQIVDDANASAKGDPNLRCGGLCFMAAPARPLWRGAAEWNRYEIVCRGQQLYATFNGAPVVGADGARRWEPAARPTAGFIGLQNFGTPVEFRGVFIKVLKEAPPAPALPQLGPFATLSGHTRGVTDVAIAPDGKTAVTGGSDQLAIVWDLAARQPLHKLKNPVGVGAVAFARDGETLAAGGKDTILLWSAHDGTKLKTLVGHAGHLGALAFAPDGNTLASGGGQEAGPAKAGDYCVRLWNVPAGTLDRRLTHPWLSHVQRLDFSANGRYLAASGFSTGILVWDLETGSPAQPLAGHRSSVRSVAFAPNADRLASASRDGTVRVWDRATGKAILTFHADAGELHAVRYSPDGRTLAVTDLAGVIRLFDAATGSPRALLIGHDGPVRGIAFTPDGRTLISGGDDATVRLWDVSAYSGPLVP